MKAYEWRCVTTILILLFIGFMTGLATNTSKCDAYLYKKGQDLGQNKCQQLKK